MINKQLINLSSPASSGGNQEEGLILHLDANDVDSYDGDGDEWIDITNHEYTPATNVSEHFNTVLYTGNSGDKTVTGVGFTPDLVWIKNIDGAFNHLLRDTVRGNDSVILPNETTAEATTTGTFEFLDDGFRLPIASSGANNSSYDYVAWCFKAGGAAVSNTDGTTTSQVSANNDLGFSIAKYIGNGSSTGATIGHGLDTTPEMIIVKDLDQTSDWAVYSSTTGNTKKLLLNNTNAAAASGVWNNTSPTSSVFTVRYSQTNEVNHDFIAYSFASKRGVSKVGSYAGSTGAVDVNTGFEPAFVMIKWTSGSIGYGGWAIYDNKRDTTSPNSKLLQANANAVELDSVLYSITMNRDGFTVGSTQNDAINYNGNNYIYYAVAKNTNETSLIPDTDLQLHLDAASFDGSTNTPSTWTDSSSNSNNGTITGATFDAELGNWLNFDGLNDEVEIPMSFSGGGSIEMWVNITDINANNAIATKYTTGTDNRSFAWYVYGSGNGVFSIYYNSSGTGNSVEFSMSDYFTSGKWHHIVHTFDASSRPTLYVDGEAIPVLSQYNSASQNVVYSRPSVPVVLGQFDGSTNDTYDLDGKIGQFRMYSTVLTQAQIRQNYNFTKPSYPNGYDFIGNNMDSTDWNSNGYFSFDGGTENFSSPSFTPSLTDVQTVSYWVRNSAISGNETVLSIGQTGNSNVYSWINFGYDTSAGAVKASYGDAIGGAKNATKTNSAYISSDWKHHCFLIFPENRGTSSQAFKIYIDGVEVAVTNSTTSNSLPTVQGYPFIGKYSGQVVNQFSGDLSSLRVYDRRLTEAEITALHSKGR